MSVSAFTIGALARRFSLARSTLLYYDRIGLLCPRGRSQGNDRLYSAADVSASSLASAHQAVAARGLTNMAIRQADIFALPFAADTFDHVFLCFVLEHLPRPREALRALKAMLRPGGTLTVIEGDYGSTFFCYTFFKAVGFKEASTKLLAGVDPMQIARFGATGGTGREVLAQALAQGHSVAALVRDPAKLADQAGLTKIPGDVLDHDPVNRCVAGADGVVCVLGSPTGQAPWGRAAPNASSPSRGNRRCTGSSS
jgi:SAM-dependent methyltransferase